MYSKNCIQCNKKFTKRVSCSKKDWIFTRFCGHYCANFYKRGKPFKHDGQIQKGSIPWNKGRTNIYPENEHYAWKGDKVGYYGLHKWVQKHLGKPTKCENCSVDGLTGRKIHWANKSHTYKRNLTDWIRLCAGCHLRYDRS